MLSEKERRRCERVLKLREEWFGRVGLDWVMLATGALQLWIASGWSSSGGALALAGTGGALIGSSLVHLVRSRDLDLLARLYAEQERGREPAPGA